jgi:hypothetical protein
MIPSEVVAKPRLPCDRRSHGPRLQPNTSKKPDLQDPVTTRRRTCQSRSWSRWPLALARGPPSLLRMRGGALWRSATGTAPGRSSGPRVGMIAALASRQPPGPGPRALQPAHCGVTWPATGHVASPPAARSQLKLPNRAGPSSWPARPGAGSGHLGSTPRRGRRLPAGVAQLASEPPSTGESPATASGKPRVGRPQRSFYQRPHAWPRIRVEP